MALSFKGYDGPRIRRPPGIAQVVFRNEGFLFALVKQLDSDDIKSISLVSREGLRIVYAQLHRVLSIQGACDLDEILKSMTQARRDSVQEIRHDVHRTWDSQRDMVGWLNSLLDKLVETFPRFTLGSFCLKRDPSSNAESQTMGVTIDRTTSNAVSRKSAIFTLFLIFERSADWNILEELDRPAFTLDRWSVRYECSIEVHFHEASRSALQTLHDIVEQVGFVITTARFFPVHAPIVWEDVAAFCRAESNLQVLQFGYEDFGDDEDEEDGEGPRKSGLLNRARMEELNEACGSTLEKLIGVQVGFEDIHWLGEVLGRGFPRLQDLEILDRGETEGWDHRVVTLSSDDHSDSVRRITCIIEGAPSWKKALAITQLGNRLTKFNFVIYSDTVGEQLHQDQLQKDFAVFADDCHRWFRRLFLEHRQAFMSLTLLSEVDVAIDKPAELLDLTFRDDDTPLPLRSQKALTHVSNARQRLLTDVIPTLSQVARARLALDVAESEALLVDRQEPFAPVLADLWQAYARTHPKQ